MLLDGCQRKRLHEALINAFPRPDLTQLVSFEMNEDLDKIAGTGILSEVTFNLIRWCESKGRVKELIRGAYDRMPDDPVFKEFYQKFCKQPGALSQRFPEAHEFDMRDLMDDCLLAIYSNHGLIGLVIPCAEESFRVKFCERLKDQLKEMGRRNIIIKQPLQLDPYVPTNEVVSRIARYKTDLTRNRDVICPVPFSIFEPNSTVPNTFWKALSEKFKEQSFQSRLIIFMYGRENVIFPNGPTRLNPPEFQPVHILRWIIKITQLAGWSESVRKVWQQKMISKCVLDPHNNLLDIRQVYEHLDWSLQLFQQNISADDFLQELDDWS
ncbi:MAG: effector-associated domain EAD1-containing protein [Leptolyngbyaceae cyanobacterium MO_188.B28]|nr:effector-associated domain EAD1-containing protein [Leptolyngbyaceae cyanobacterium MO_188.B28]